MHMKNSFMNLKAKLEISRENMRKVTIAIMIVLLLLALFVYYDLGMPHPTPVSTLKTLPGSSQILNYSGSYSYANYTILLTDYKNLVANITLLVNSFHQDLTFAYQRGLIIGVFAGLFIGFLFGAVLEGVRRKTKTE
jgi:hypothetical protein